MSQMDEFAACSLIARQAASFRIMAHQFCAFAHYTDRNSEVNIYLIYNIDFASRRGKRGDQPQK